jgi:hypothetical protein
MKTYWGSGCTVPRTLHLGTSWRWVVSFTPLPLYRRVRVPRYHWIGGWVGPGTGLEDVEMRKILLLTGLELRPLDRSACSQSLYQLRRRALKSKKTRFKLAQNIKMNGWVYWGFIWTATAQSLHANGNTGPQNRRLLSSISFPTDSYHFILYNQCSWQQRISIKLAIKPHVYPKYSYSYSGILSTFLCLGQITAKYYRKNIAYCMSVF